MSFEHLNLVCKFYCPMTSGIACLVVLLGYYCQVILLCPGPLSQ